MTDQSNQPSTSQLKRILEERGVDYSQCVEKNELMQLVKATENATAEARAAKLEEFKRVMDVVYGKLEGLPQHWIPKPYQENKGRYLWTDAFGVCNFITLFHEKNEEKYLLQADNLITNVHDVLGKVCRPISMLMRIQGQRRKKKAGRLYR
jgi:hypothetical protein